MCPQLLKLTALCRIASGLGMIVTAIMLSWQDLRTRYVSAAAAGLFMMIASKLSRRISGREMIGNGDVWFAFATGLGAQGTENALDMLATAFLLAVFPAIISIVRYLCRRFVKDAGAVDEVQSSKRSIREICRSEIPFFPFLALSLFIIRAKTRIL